MLSTAIDTPSAQSKRYDEAMPKLLPKSSPARRSGSVALSRGGGSRLVLATVALLAAWAPASAQSIADGMLLVASPMLEDPNFSRTVVLVLRHDGNGTLGVVVNRPTTLEPAVVFPELATGVGAYTGRLYRGGPVSPARVLFLVRGLAAATVQGPEILDKVFLSADPESLADVTRLANGTDDLRVYAGHAEWVPGQLESEIAAGGWRPMPGTAELVFHAEPGRLWAELAARGDEVVAATDNR
jgi:putative transcriptional regulator